MYQLEKFEVKHCLDLMKIFDSNMPQYFDPVERPEFESWLKGEKGSIGEYFICKNDAKMVGAGGYCEEEQAEARICWLMIDASIHQKGAGTYMMNEFKRKIIADKSYDRITLKTTQHTDKFYESLGYKTTYYEEDHWVKGLHLYFMEMDL